jgi:hypothetical protein
MSAFDDFVNRMKSTPSPRCSPYLMNNARQPVPGPEHGITSSMQQTGSTDHWQSQQQWSPQTSRLTVHPVQKHRALAATQLLPPMLGHDSPVLIDLASTRQLLSGAWRASEPGCE